MKRAPKDPREVFDEFVADCRKAFGEELKAVCLYGSGARGEYVPGRSDLNFLLLLSERGIRELDRAFDLVAKWRKRNVAVPLFLTEEYIKQSLDSFPLEFLDMKLHHLLLYGTDPFEDLQIRKEDLRLQCEREAKGKLLILREAYVSSGGRPRDLSTLLARSIVAFSIVFEGLLYLKGLEIPPDRSGVIRALCEVAGLRKDIFLAVLSIKAGTVKPTREELLQLIVDYIEEVRKLAFWVDKMEEGRR